MQFPLWITTVTGKAFRYDKGRIEAVQLPAAADGLRIRSTYEDRFRTVHLPAGSPVNSGSGDGARSWSGKTSKAALAGAAPDGMSKRIDKSWTVYVSVENLEHDRCVDFFSRSDGSFGFEEFRRDIEESIHSACS